MKETAFCKTHEKNFVTKYHSECPYCLTDKENEKTEAAAAAKKQVKKGPKPKKPAPAAE